MNGERKKVEELINSLPLEERVEFTNAYYDLWNTRFSHDQIEVVMNGIEKALVDSEESNLEEG